MKQVKSLFKESLYATGFILISIYLLSLIEFNSDVMNPIAKAFGDFELTDIVFAHMKESPDEDTNIVMVNLGPYHRDRDDLARMIEILAYYKPKVVGIDAFFRKPRKNAEIDSALARAFSKLEHLVLVSENHENLETGEIDSMETSHAMFMRYAEPGFADMITKGEHFFKTSRECSPKEKVKAFHKWVDTIVEERELVDGEISYVKVDTVIWDEKEQKEIKKTIEKEVILNPKYETVKRKKRVWKKFYKDTVFYSFPVKIASIYAPEKAKKFIERNNDTEIINFQGNIDVREDDVSRNAKNVFTVLDVHQVEDTLFTPELIKGKIVIIGYMGDYTGDVAWEDKFFTPLNANYIGKANPDMFGVVVHANIVSMILREDYINVMPDWLMYCFSLILIFLNVWFFAYLYHKSEEWYDGLSLLITLAEILVLMIIVLAVFVKYDYKIDITLASVALLLTGNLIEIHFGIVKPTVLKLANKLPGISKIIPIFKN
jgi:CHASE2 domain-containing sensor protein